MSLSSFDADGQGELWIPTEQIARSPGHPFYVKLNRVLRQEQFDRRIETLCAPYYKAGGRPSIALGVYFRMLLIGYFEGIDSQRGIAWRCADSLALREFLGLKLTQRAPDHSSLTRIRQRLPLAVHEQMFAMVLEIGHKRGLLRGKTILVDSTTLEANAAMRSIVRKDTGEDWTQYLTRLAKADGIAEPTAEDLARYDQKRKDKKVGNEEWQSRTDPEARIAKMKDGTTHLAYKAEHAVDVDSGLIVAAAIEPAAGAPDHETIKGRAIDAQANLLRAGSEQAVEEAVADKGYHKTESLAWLAGAGIRTYIPEKKERGKRRWKNWTASQNQAYRANRRRVRGVRGRRLLRRRGELVERSFAHVCETGGARRAWLRGAEEIAKYYQLRALAFNLGIILRRLFGIGKPRVLQGGMERRRAAIFALWRAWRALWRAFTAPLRRFFVPIAEITNFIVRTIFQIVTSSRFMISSKRPERSDNSTGC
jgi:transposase